MAPGAYFSMTTSWLIPLAGNVTAPSSEAGQWFNLKQIACRIGANEKGVMVTLLFLPGSFGLNSALLCPAPALVSPAVSLKRQPRGYILRWRLHEVFVRGRLRVVDRESVI